METAYHLELISKLWQRLVRLIKLGEPNQLRLGALTSDDGNSIRTPIDLTANVEDCVRRLFTNSYSVELFIQEVQRLLNVTIKSNLGLFLAETIPFAHQYLQQHQYDPLSWETFKTIMMQTPSNINSNLQNQTTALTRLPSLQQARFRLPPSCPQLIDLTSSFITQSQPEETSVIPNIRIDANPYQEKLIHRFAEQQFYLHEGAEELFLQALNNFLRHIIRRLHFYTEHRIDTQLFNSSSYEMSSNVREQIRFLIELHKCRNGELNNNLHASSLQRKDELINGNDEEQKRARTREYRLSIIEEIRQKEANETACLVLRESRSKRQKLSDNHRKMTPFRLLRANLQDLIFVMENMPILRRSKTLLYAYANR